jgi:hypothetical protein
VAEIGYLGNQGHRLERYLYYNQAVPGATGTVTQRSPYPELGLIAEVDNRVNSNYHSLSAKVTRRMSKGLTYLAGYTFSKAIDDGGGIRPLGSDPLFAQTSYCLSCERALSVFDARQRFVSSVLYDLPFGKGRRFLNHGLLSNILGGWELSSIVTASSGFPLTVVVGTDRSQTATGVNSDRPNLTGESYAVPSGQPGPRQWFNIGAFAMQPLGTYGNGGRNTVIGPGIVNWDFSTLKNFNFTESRYLQFRFEAFNFLNHPNWGDPDTILTNNRLDASGRAIPGTGSFGTITSTRVAMRQLQFSLKFIF